MTHPAYTSYEALTHDTFSVLMWSLSYPGRVYTLPHTPESAFHAIAETLLDIETSFFTPDDAMMTTYMANGARPLGADRAAYHFYSALDIPDLDSVQVASIGTLMYPDQSATLIIGATIGAGQRLTFTGPGIKPQTPATISIDGIPPAFWELRQKAIRYPRGWDVYFVDSKCVIGLPRTTVVHVEE
ncbi:MAG: phosphonate C-P lyase system protein PhnH [Chloroflexota bacterium]